MRSSRLVITSLSLSLLAFASVAHADDIQDPILGGTATAVGDFPAVVAVSTMNGGAATICTGTLIAPTWVMTAAHCVTPSLAGFSSQAALTAATTVHLDALEAFGGTMIKAMDTIPNPSFNINALGNNDIGLVELVSPVNDRMFAHLNRSATDAPVGISVTMVGYGETDPSNNQSAGILHTLTNKVSVSCADYNLSNTDLICYDQGNGTGKCEGDSGGPSFGMINGKLTQVGITSFGDQTCAQFGADTRVDEQVAFADSHVGPSLKCAYDGVCNTTCAGTDQDCPKCTSNSDCTGSNEFCNPDGACEPNPLTTGGLGETCTTGADCFSGDCAGTSATDMKCITSCSTIGANTCPTDFDCLPTGSGGQGACWPGANAEAGGGSGGCAASSSSDLAPLGLGLVLLALVSTVGRRRRRVTAN